MMTLGINMNVYGWIKDAVFLKSYINVCVWVCQSICLCLDVCVCRVLGGGGGEFKTWNCNFLAILRLSRDLDFS